MRFEIPFLLGLCTLAAAQVKIRVYDDDSTKCKSGTNKATDVDPSNTDCHNFEGGFASVDNPSDKNTVIDLYVDEDCQGYSYGPYKAPTSKTPESFQCIKAKSYQVHHPRHPH